MSAAVRPNNNFNLLRLLAAAAVVLAHAYDLQGIPGHRDLYFRVTGFSLGTSAVLVFFVISGYLLTRSLLKNPDPVRYVRNRFLRIMPGLAVCGIATTLALGLLQSSLPFSVYLADPETWRYMLGVATMVDVSGSLPGVFQANPLGDHTNGSLWTLPFEVLCYAVLLALFLAGLLRPRVFAWTAGGFVAAAIVYPVLPLLHPNFDADILIRLHRLGYAFGLGMVAAHLGYRARAWHVLAALGMAVLLDGTAYAAMAVITALASFALWFGHLQNHWLSRARAWPDYSYGLYIYAFPIQQSLVLPMQGTHSNVQAAVALVLALGIAALSWHFVEAPALELKHRSARSAAASIATM